MKQFLSLLLTAASVAQAQTFSTTNNECWKGEGGRYKGECKDVYFFTCDIYLVEPDTACNVYVFSDSRLTWFSQDLSVYYWTYYKASGVDKKADVTGDDFESSKCNIENDTPSTYEKGLVMNYTGGMCGTKYQIGNADTFYDNEFKVMKDGASTLLLGAATAILAVLAF